jgi:hypothetical protein
VVRVSQQTDRQQQIPASSAYIYRYYLDDILINEYIDGEDWTTKQAFATAANFCESQQLQSVQQRPRTLFIGFIIIIGKL